MELPKERERERTKKKRGILLERSTHREMRRSLFLLSLHTSFHLNLLLGGKQAEDKRLVLFYLVVVLVAEDGRAEKEREE
jgi:hypothetical protein